MKLRNKLLTLAMTLFIAVCSINPITTYGKQERSQAAKSDFKELYPCPKTGKSHGACTGWIIDHLIPLACGGADAPYNMQWQDKTAAKAKDKWERKGCSVSRSKYHSYSNGNQSSSTLSSNNYYTGSRGGCFTYSASGKKRYVDHLYCGR